MRNLLFVVSFVIASFCANAQKVYFIYLQTDNTNPFYLKMNDQIYSSAASGYLILSNLVDSTYNFSIGFPSSQSETRFTVTIAANDKGYLIKKFESGIGLFDLQNLTIINAQKDEVPKNIAYKKRDDDFSYMLSKAANDTSLLYAVVKLKAEASSPKEKQNLVSDQLKLDSSAGKTVEVSLKTDSSLSGTSKPDVVFEAPAKDSQAIVETKPDAKFQDSASLGQPKGPQKQDDVIIIDSKADTKTDTAWATSKESTGAATNSVVNIPSDTLSKHEEKPVMETGVPDEQAFKRSIIKKHSESSTSEGFGLVYYDDYNGKEDTIRLLIPNPPVIIKQPEQDSSQSQKQFIQIDELKKDAEQKSIDAPSTNSTIIKSDCKAVASNNDFFKLRKNMASEDTDEGMVAQAKKFFKSKCFTTEQIKNLSALFLTSAGKYQFFDAAYFHVSDQQNFISLQSEIKDDYYLKRFKALVGE